MHNLPCYTVIIDYVHCIGSWDNNMQKGENSTQFLIYKYILIIWYLYAPGMANSFKCMALSSSRPL